MLRWKITAFLGLVFGVAGIAWGYAQRSTVGFSSFGYTRPYQESGTPWLHASQTELLPSMQGTELPTWVTGYRRRAFPS